MVMTSWLLSIAGIVILGALIEILLTDSPMSKFVRGIFGFFVLFVIVSPLPGLIDDGMTAMGGDVMLNEDLLNNINQQTARAMERNAMQVLDTAGFFNVIVTITNDRVFVNAMGVVLAERVQNVNIEQEIRRIVTMVTRVDEGRIIYVG